MSTEKRTVGRPSGKRFKPRVISIPIELDEDLAKEAERQQVPMSNIVVEGLRRYLKYLGKAAKAPSVKAPESRFRLAGRENGLNVVEFSDGAKQRMTDQEYSDLSGSST